MKWIVSIALMLTTLPVFSQMSGTDFNKMDRPVEIIKPAAPVVLAQQLTASCTTELEKVKAIFQWITENIDYRIRDPKNAIKKPVIYDQPEDTGALKPLDERVAESVLDKRSAVCDGYARLFKTLCSFAGIRSELITGYARTESWKINQRFRSNHTWNAVMIDSVWKLLDVTWASGFVSVKDNIFMRQYDEEYFLTSPRQFIREHYPDDIRWTLMQDPPLMPEFNGSPFRQRTFMKYNITTFKPATGIIEVALGDTVQVELETADLTRDRQIGADPFSDTSIYTTPGSALLIPSIVLANKTSYIYPVTSGIVGWLYILYNDDVIMRYKLLIKKEKKDLAVTH